jgi:mRNA-degrading endonuclease toxin of MazEF toxin-antitoxin module
MSRRTKSPGRVLVLTRDDVIARALDVVAMPASRTAHDWLTEVEALATATRTPRDRQRDRDRPAQATQQTLSGRARSRPASIASPQLSQYP